MTPGKIIHNLSVMVILFVHAVNKVLRGLPVRVFLVLIIMGNVHELGCQQIISQIDIPAGYFSGMIRDNDGNYLMSLWKNTSSDSVKVGDTAVYTYRKDANGLPLDILDFYLLKFDEDHNLLASFVIDNAESVYDCYSEGGKVIVSMTLHQQENQDSLYPILINGSIELPREGIMGKGVLFVLDSLLNLEEIIFPSSGPLRQVALDGQYAYLELSIPDFEPYIVVGADTIENFIQEDSSAFGYKTIVLCKYDLLQHKVIWVNRMGGLGEEWLWDIQLDSEKNLVMNGITSSFDFYFWNNESAGNYQFDKPFVVKCSPDGQLDWHILRTQQNGEFFHTVRLDEQDNVYLFGTYHSNTYSIGDTVLYNPKWQDVQPTIRSLIIKYSADSEYEWCYQLDGDFQLSGFHEMAIQNNKLIIGGNFLKGTAYFGSEAHYTVPPLANLFLLQLDCSTGTYKKHLFHEADHTGYLISLFFNNQGFLDMQYLFGGEGAMFGATFSSQGEIIYFLTLDLQMTQNQDLPYNVESPLVIYPNPAHTTDRIYLKANSALDFNSIQCHLYNSSGIELNTQIIVPNDTDNYITLEGLNPGAYFLRFVSEGKTFCQKIILQ